MEPIDLSGMALRRLLGLYSEILTELLRRGVVRSRNAPAGDLAEALVAAAYEGKLAPPSEKSWDVRAADGRALQVKCRVLEAGDNRSHAYSPFRSWSFDACVFILLDSVTYDVTKALEVPVAQVEEASREVAWVRGHRLHVRQDLAALPGARDVTSLVRAAFDALDREHPDSPRPQSEPALAAGACLCGCGQATSGRARFVSSHDRRAESRIIREHYGSIANFVIAHPADPRR